MSEMPEHGLGMVEEDEATGEITNLYETIKQEFQVPHVPNVMKAIAVSPASLQFYVDMFVSFYENSALPQSLTAMIFYAVSRKNDSAYFTAAHKMLCLQAGINEETLMAVPDRLDEIESERTRTIVEFALKAAKYPQDLDSDDYGQVRALGIDNNEILQILFVAGIAVYIDLVANALNVEVDPELTDTPE